MTDSIQKVAVIGAGVMGAGIAAQITNAGVEVLLLDIVPEGAKDRNVITQGAVDKLKKSKPAAFMHPKNAKLITVGNIDDDLEKIADCDWIVEVVIERLDIKQALYKKIEKFRKKGAIVSSNTSTLPIEVLTKGMTKKFCKNFMITHFFNPPRYMRLLEIVVGDETDAKSVAAIREFVDIKLGKSVVDCKDTPGFIANRIGTYWLHAAVTKAIHQNITVEAADSVLGRPSGIPRTGIFGLLDLVGLDLMPHILSSFEEALPKSDPFIKLGKTPDILPKMVESGYTGRKGKGGFYRLNDKKQKEVVDLATLEYSIAKRPQIDATKAFKKGGLRAVLMHDSAEGRYAFDVLAHTLNYAASLVPEIADTVEQVDRAMRLGYNWKFGPFELIDQLGTEWFVEQLKAHKMKVPALLKKADGRSFYRKHAGKLQYLDIKGVYQDVERPEGVLLLQDIKRYKKPLFKNISASVWDIDDGIACLEFHSKMNALDPFSIMMISKAVKELPKRGFKGLVIHNEGTNFSVGANIGMLLVTSKLRAWPLIRMILKQGQDTLQRMKFSNFPVVGAPSGMALGGGCEVLLHCNAIEAYAETYTGLVEAGVGIVPGWGGCKEMLGRASQDPKTQKGPMPQVMKTFETIALAKVATSAHEAQDMLFFKKDDGVVMNKDRVLQSAKDRALKMAEDFQAPEPYVFTLPGESGASALQLGLRDFVNKGVATPHDATIATELALTLTGDTTDVVDECSEDTILKLERDSIVKLTKTPETRARIVHLLKKGKPLRN